MGSWDELVEEYLMEELAGGKKLASGAVFGLDGSLYAQTESFPEMSTVEYEHLKDGFNDAALLAKEGIKFNGEKYISIQGEAGSIVRGRGLENKAAGFTAKITEGCMVIGFFGEGVQPGQCSNLVEKFADYLAESGY